MNGTEERDPLAIASLVCVLLGGVVYCCGSFLCIGPLGMLVWLIGAVLGGVAMSRHTEGPNRTMGLVGLVLNLLPLVGMGLLIVVSVVIGGGLGVLGALVDA